MRNYNRSKTTKPGHSATYHPDANTLEPNGFSRQNGMGIITFNAINVDSSRKDTHKSLASTSTKHLHLSFESNQFEAYSLSLHIKISASNTSTANQHFLT